MLLYHGTNVDNIVEFDLSKSRTALDFGIGVYLTTSQEQAEERAVQKTLKEKNSSSKPTVYIFDVDIDKLKCVKYESEELNYVLYLCRIELEDVAKDAIDNFDNADVIIGEMLVSCISKFKDLAEDFNSGLVEYMDLERCIKLSGDQLCFKSQRAVDLLNQGFIRKYKVTCE